MILEQKTRKNAYNALVIAENAKLTPRYSCHVICLQRCGCRCEIAEHLDFFIKVHAEARRFTVGDILVHHFTEDYGGKL